MGMMICIEGLDAAGKATQSKLLAQRIIEVGREAALYSFPRYETEVGKAIRRHLMSETMLAEENLDDSANSSHARAPEDALMFQCLTLADKCDATTEMRRHLRLNRFVVCDRWTPSGIAFGAADGLSLEWLERASSALPEATLNIFIDVDEDEALRRRPRMRDRYEKDRAKQAVVRAEYKRLWAKNELRSDSAWVRVDGNGSVEEVFARIWSQVCALAPGLNV